MFSNATPGTHHEPARRWPWAMAQGSSAIVFYLLAFNSVELGMLKVPILTALFGHLLASVFATRDPAEVRN
jgi:hypothetical protein